MTSSADRRMGQGPFVAEQLRTGDPYELSHGHPIYCAPTGSDGTGPNGLGFSVLDTDPAVVRAGVDTGLKLADGTLRAPDVAVGFEDGAGTWARAAKLAVEYAGRGQDEADLRAKIEELLDAGTRWVWVVRLVGLPRVEVHERGSAVRTFAKGQAITAPGGLQNPVPVAALFDRDAAHEASLANLLQRRGYADLDAVREEGREEGRGEGREEGALAEARAAILRVGAARGLVLSDADRRRIETCVEVAMLGRWLVRAATVGAADEVVGGG